MCSWPVSLTLRRQLALILFTEKYIDVSGAMKYLNYKKGGFLL